MKKHKAYGNIEVYSSEGILMFRCSEDKLKFYKKNDLIEKTGPDMYKLKFRPAGLGHGERNRELLEPRENKCVCCGNDDLEVLTRHHIVPTRYRRLFPNHIKGNNHRYLVMMCWACHSMYNNFEQEYDQRIFEELQVQDAVAAEKQLTINRQRVRSCYRTLTSHSDKIPPERLQKLQDEFRSITGKEPTIENLKEANDAVSEPIDYNDRHHGAVVRNIKNFYEFQQGWLEHFVASMNPQYLPRDLRLLLD